MGLRWNRNSTPSAAIQDLDFKSGLTIAESLNTSSGRDRQDAVLWISETLKKAIDKIYDPVEGGFFRYAEKDNWDIPHYEKMAGLNAGSILLLYKVNKEIPNPEHLNMKG